MTTPFNEKAELRFAPVFSGDGYGYGGGAVLCIGRFAIPLGEHPDATALANEVCRRWNAGDINWNKLFVACDVEGYVEKYELCGDEGYYRPNEQEKALLIDAIYGVVNNLHEEMRKIIPSSPSPQPKQEGDQ